MSTGKNPNIDDPLLNAVIGEPKEKPKPIESFDNFVNKLLNKDKK